MYFFCEVLGGNLHAVNGEASKFRYFARAELPAMSTEYPLDILLPQPGQLSFFSANFESVSKLLGRYLP